MFLFYHRKMSICQLAHVLGSSNDTVKVDGLLWGRHFLNFAICSIWFSLYTDSIEKYFGVGNILLQVTTLSAMKSKTYAKKGAVSATLFTAMPWLRALLALTVLCNLLVTVFTILQLFVLSTLLTQVFLQHISFSQASLLFWLLLALMSGRALFMGAREIAAQRGAVRVKAALRQRVAAHLLHLGPVYMQNERTGELAATLGEGIERLDAYVSRYLPQLVLSVLVPLLILLVVGPLDILSALLLLITAPIIPVLMFLVGSSAARQTRLQWLALARMSAHFLDVVQGLPTLKLFGRGQTEQERVARISEAFRKKTMSTLRLAFLSGAVLDFLVAMAIGLVAVMLGIRLLVHGIALRDALFVLLLTPEFYHPLRELGTARHAGLEGQASAARLLEILNQPPSIHEPTTPAHVPTSPLEIVFHDVWHTYPDSSHATLRGVELTLPACMCTALVGRSGSGKSTLARLLLRHMACSQGEITVNGVPLTALPVEQWRQAVAWVPQRPYLFCGTILENIRLARPTARDDEIYRAAELAGAQEFIQRLPEGFATQIGERGARLSAGQAQRLAIARAFLKDAPLLILDEPTSNLDPESERALRQALERLIPGRTVLLIAHCWNTLAAANRVVALEQGRLREAGSPQAWLQHNRVPLLVRPDPTSEEVQV